MAVGLRGMVSTSEGRWRYEYIRNIITSDGFRFTCSDNLHRHKKITTLADQAWWLFLIKLP